MKFSRYACLFGRPAGRQIPGSSPSLWLPAASASFFFFKLAATCFPTPSPAQYHRPPAS